MMRLRLALVGSIMLAATGGAAAQATNPFLGQVLEVPYDFCPEGWTEMNGQLLLIDDNPQLFSLLLTYYGGDGLTTFALPATKPRFTATGVPLRECIALQGIFPSRPRS
jgi:microcystin-dependent protein